MKSICIQKKGQKVIRLKYKIKSKEQAAYETIMGLKSDLSKVLFFIIAEGFNWDVINYIIKDWKHEEIWRMAFQFAEKLGNNIPTYNAGVMLESKIPKEEKSNDNY